MIAPAAPMIAPAAPLFAPVWPMTCSPAARLRQGHKHWYLPCVILVLGAELPA